MNFGYNSYEQLTEDHFTFTQIQQMYLPGIPAPDPKLYIGLPKWGDESWRGKIYPEKAKSTSFLQHYSKRFNAIELNATHYKIPSVTQVENWAALADVEDFQFCPKFAKVITHQGLISKETKSGFTDEFINSVSAFGNKLGPCFLQLGDKVYYDNNKDILLEYLSSLPKHLNYFIELRHPYWFQSAERMAELSSHLNRLNIGWVITDTIDRRDAAHMYLSVPHAFIRFVCKGDEALDRQRISNWKVQLKEWYSKGLQSCHFFFHVHNEEVKFDFIAYAEQELKQALIR